LDTPSCNRIGFHLSEIRSVTFNLVSEHS